MNDGSDLAMGKAQLAVCFLLLLLFSLGGCSKQPTAPSEYVLGDNKLPALQEALGADEEISESFSESLDSDTQEKSYAYSGLESGRDTVSEYVSYLIEKENCSVIDSKGEIQENPKISGESGEVFIGRAGTAEDGVFFLKIVWEEDSCIITPVFQEDMKIHTQETDGGVLNYNEIVSRFRAYTPSELGLSGESMEEYSIFPEEGYVMVNDQPGIRVNIYNPSTHAYQASYIITADGSHVFQWDRKTQQIVELPVK